MQDRERERFRLLELNKKDQLLVKTNINSDSISVWHFNRIDSSRAHVKSLHDEQDEKNRRDAANILIRQRQKEADQLVGEFTTNVSSSALSRLLNKFDMKSNSSSNQSKISATKTTQPVEKHSSTFTSIDPFIHSKSSDLSLSSCLAKKPLQSSATLPQKFSAEEMLSLCATKALSKERVKVPTICTSLNDNLKSLLSNPNSYSSIPNNTTLYSNNNSAPSKSEKITAEEVHRVADAFEGVMLSLKTSMKQNSITSNKKDIQQSVSSSLGQLFNVNKNFMETLASGYTESQLNDKLNKLEVKEMLDEKKQLITKMTVECYYCKQCDRYCDIMDASCVQKKTSN